MLGFWNPREWASLIVSNTSFKVGVDYTLSLRPSDYSLWTFFLLVILVRKLGCGLSIAAFAGGWPFYSLLPSSGNYPTCCTFNFLKGRGWIDFRSFPQFTVVQLVLKSNFLLKKHNHKFNFPHIGSWMHALEVSKYSINCFKTDLLSV